MMPRSSRVDVRPGTLDDVPDIVSLLNAASRRWIGVDVASESHLRVDFERPGFDPASDTILIRDAEGVAVAYGEVVDLAAPHTLVTARGGVHPDRLGRGLGTIVHDWILDRAMRAVDRAPAGARVVLHQTIGAEDAAGERFLTDRGYHPVRHLWTMIAELASPPVIERLPADLRIRSFDAEADLEATCRLVREAFAGQWGVGDAPFEEDLAQWRHIVDEDGDFTPDLWLLAGDGVDLVGSCLGWPTSREGPSTGWIFGFAVAERWRRRGVGLALLTRTLSELYRIGLRRVGLGVDAANPTGAVALYERAGMSVARRRRAYELVLCEAASTPVNFERM